MATQGLFYMSVDLDYLAGLFIHGFPVLNADDQVLALILYRILVQGKPVTLKQLAQASGLSTEPNTACKSQTTASIPGVPGTAYSSPNCSVPR